MHTLLVREHNRIARIFGQLNPHWDDETVFQEVRRVVIAIMQHITYYEYLPTLLSPNTMKKYNLNFIGYYTRYNSTIDPRISNEV